MRASWGATSDMIPLPPALDGQKTQRTITIDRALLYLINAALTGLVDFTRYEQTGSLTVQDALSELETMIEEWYAQP